MIVEWRWEIKRRTEACRISRADYDHKPDGLEYYEQALIDKEVFTFYSYPLDDREA